MKTKPPTYRALRRQVADWERQAPRRQLTIWDDQQMDIEDLKEPELRGEDDDLDRDQGRRLCGTRARERDE